MTPEQLETLADTIARHDLERYAKRLLTAIDRDIRGGNTLADGHARTRGYDGARSGGDGLTPTERAADSRRTPMRDEHHRLTAAATRAALDLAQTLDRLAGLLTGIDDLIRPTPRTDLEPGCRSCERHHDATGTPHYSARFRGDLCRWCYGWTNDNPELNPKRQLPPVELIARRARGERITTATVSRLELTPRARTRRKRGRVA